MEDNTKGCHALQMKANTKDFNAIQDELAKGPNPAETEEAEKEESAADAAEKVIKSMTEEELNAAIEEVAEEYKLNLETSEFTEVEIYAMYFRLLYALSTMDFVANSIGQVASSLQRSGDPNWRAINNISQKATSAALALQPLLQKTEGSGVGDKLADEDDKFQFILSAWLTKETHDKLVELLKAAQRQSSVLGPDGTPAKKGKPSILVP